MHLPRCVFVLGFISSLAIIGQQAYANKTKLNYSLLIGEWSTPGKCGQERYVYTSNNKYAWMQKKGRVWKVAYQGIYVRDPKRGSVITADGPNMGGYVIDIYELNQKTFRGEWNTQLSDGLSFENPEDAKFSYIRCSGKVFK